MLLAEAAAAQTLPVERFAESPDLKIVTPAGADSFWRMVARLGDINGDGFEEFIVASGFANNSRGRAWVYFGPDATTSAPFIFDGEADGDFFGGAGDSFAVDGGGDFNADGVPDIVVGAQRNDGDTGDPDDNRGATYVYSGADGSLIARFTGEASIGDLFGSSVATADVNGDGTRDMIVAGPGNGTGAVYVFFMPPPPPPCPGDINGDGVVNGADLSFVLNNWGPCPTDPCCPCRGDVTGDGVVNGVDISFILNAFGPCPAAGQQAAAQSGANGWSNGAANLLGGFGFSSAEAYIAWLESLDDEALHKHIMDLIKAVQSQTP